MTRALNCFTVTVVMSPVAIAPRVQRKVFAVALMLGLYLTLHLLAASDALHHCVHEDSHAADHQCVIKLVADGQLLVAPVPQLELQPNLVFSAPSERPLVIVVGAERLLPPGRAPPASPA